MKKKFFNPKLYLEGLNQLKLMGFILTLFTMLVTAIPPIAEIIDNINLKHNTIGYSKTIVDDVVMIAPCVLVFMYLGAYIFSNFIFSWGNKRKASDFYDSLQNTRVCTYVSFGLAALTWIVAIILLNNMEGLFLYNIAGDIVFTPWDFIRFNIYEILVALGVAGATFVAMALTGTAFSNFMVMAIVLLLPRFCITFLQVIILDEARTIAASSLMGLWDPAHNLITGVFTAVIGYNFNYLLSNTWGYIYTFVLDAVYFALAGLFYHIRKTETAEKSAPNRLMQHVIRCGLTLPFGLFFGFAVYYVVSDGYWSDVIIPLLLFALAAFIYFVYEAITTKSFKRLFASAPLFLAVIVVSVITMYGGVFAAFVMDEKIPDADKIKCITVSEYDYNTDSYGDYMDIVESKIKYDDKELIEKVIRDLEMNVQGKNQLDTIVAEKYSSTVTSSFTGALEYNDYNNYVKFYYKSGRTEVRRVDFTVDTDALLDEIRAKTPEYINAIYEIPTINVVNCNIDSLDSELSKEVYSIYSKEVKELPYETLKNLVGSYNGVDISVTVNHNGAYSYSNFTITQDTPKALAKYLELSNNEITVTEFFKNLRTDEETFVSYVDLYFYNVTSGLDGGFYLDSIPDEVDPAVYDKINALIKTAATRDPQDKRYTMYTINAYSDYEKNGEYFGSSAHGSVLFMSQQEMNELAELLAQIGVVGNENISVVTRTEG